MAQSSLARPNTSPYTPPPRHSGDSLHHHHPKTPRADGDSATMNSREPSDMPPAPSYPSPNAAQMGQGTMQYYNRQLTADELLSAELSRETAGANLADSSSNGLHHGQSMVLGPSNPAASEMGRASSADQQHGNMLPFPPNQQVGVDPNHDLSYGDQSARRKRSKVSRACDECRRKKVCPYHPCPRQTKPS
jgi:hypothetical protein